mmetsp:Transcript_1845/g.1948  ORF Transcript_1845/g.1948 Transcript_1845/m.1948 type:complete len:136 (+) Transcript_1845:65-472(+)|eukprot:CAMPEP_0114978218 /NCGR_PEP_ID=MMETSP0216-20121206/3686_1 /TAXON_ID=223996 /ORGANISM="Protocruzia adherens, Strain Boccale" /LENGTH=135 /DNA_ID=CAMNT_0002339393 /DNA_START=42 /DNA_END=449 /DNA_ORIENTATION=-
MAKGGKSQDAKKTQSNASAKAQKAKAGGKAKKKKWSKGKTKDKLNNAVLFDKALYDRVNKELPTLKLISISTLSEKFKITGSLARVAITELKAKGILSVIDRHHTQWIYKKSASAPATTEATTAAAGGKKKKGGK